MAIQRRRNRNSVRSTQLQIRCHAERIEIKVRLVEPIEKHQPIGPSRHNALRHIGQRREIRAELHGDRDANLSPQIAHQIEIAGLQFTGCEVSIGGKIIDVQFQRICPSVFDALRVFDPPTGRDTVQAPNDRNSDGRFQPLDVLQIALWADAIGIEIGKVADALSVAVGASSR